jgi:hypothetical protein
MLQKCVTYATLRSVTEAKFVKEPKWTIASPNWVTSNER